MARGDMHRSDVVVAVGGGVVTDVAGYAASSYHRGTAVINVPTTLLGQVDAAIGGKTGVNLPEGKNLVGSFWQPLGVFCDTETLASLPKREWRSGHGEMAKYAFLGVEDLDSLSLAEQVARCVACKAQVVASDERDGGRRMILNYGHTLAHALEAAGFASEDASSPESRASPRRSGWHRPRVRGGARAAHGQDRDVPGRAAPSSRRRLRLAGEPSSRRRPRRSGPVHDPGQEVGRWPHLDARRSGRCRAGSRRPPRARARGARCTPRRPMSASGNDRTGRRPVLLLLSGPNLGLLGERQPEIYGTATLADHVDARRQGGDPLRIRVEAPAERARGRPRRSRPRRAAAPSTAIVVNAGALSHSSWALHDALAAFDGVVVELHLSNPDAREPWRRQSVVAPVADGTVAGFGGLGYELAVEAAARLVIGRNSGPSWRLASPPMPTGSDRPDLAAMDVAGRIPRLAARFAELGCDGLLVTNLTNVRYLTGFTGSAGLLLVLPDDALLVSDGRYRRPGGRGGHRSGRTGAHRDRPASRPGGDDRAGGEELATPGTGGRRHHLERPAASRRRARTGDEARRGARCGRGGFVPSRTRENLHGSSARRTSPTWPSPR